LFKLSAEAKYNFIETSSLTTAVLNSSKIFS